MDTFQAARRRMTIALFLAQSSYSAAMIASFTLLPIVAAQLGGSDSAAGVPSTVNLLGRAMIAYPIGWLMDRVGRRFGLALGYGLGAVGMAVAAWAIMAHNFLLFLAGVALFGMGRGSSEQGRYVAAEIQLPDNRAKALGWIVFAGTIGAVAGPGLVGPSGTWAMGWGLPSQSGPYAAGAVLALVGFVLILVLMRPDPKTLISAELAHPEQASSTGRPLLSLFANSKVLLALSAMTIGQLVMVLIMVITPLHMDRQEHGTGQISLVIMAHTLGMFGLSWLTGSLIDRIGRLVMIVVGSLILVVSAVMTPLVGTVPMLAVALFLLGLGWNFCFVAGSSLLAESVAPEEKGRVQGASEVVVSLASGAGSLGTGLVFAGGGIVAVSALGLAFVIALLAIAGWFRWAHNGAVVEPA